MQWSRNTNILKNNDVWEVVPRSEDKSVVSSKWIFKKKHSVDGSIEKHKDIFVARGFSQKEGIDYEETFSLVARYTSIRSILSLIDIREYFDHLSRILSVVQYKLLLQSLHLGMLSLCPFDVASISCWRPRQEQFL